MNGPGITTCSFAYFFFMLAIFYPESKRDGEREREERRERGERQER